MNLSPIGTAYKQSQSKSFDGIGTAAQDGIGSFMDMFGQVAEKRKSQVDNEVKKSFANFMAAMQHRKALEPPKPTPVLNKQDMAPMGIALLLALLTKQKSQDIAQFGQGFMDARGQAAGRQDQFNQQTWQTQNENAQQDQRYEIERAKMGYDAALDERSRMDTFGREGRQRADERWKQDQLTNRALIRSPEKVEYYKMLGKTPEGRMELTMAVRGNDPDAIEAARQLTEQEKLLASRRQTVDAMRPGQVEGQGLRNENVAARTEGTKLNNEYLSKTLNDRIDIIASKKGIDSTKLAIIKKDLQYYDEDRALKVSQARARIAASERSNATGAPLSPTEERMRAKTILGSTKELMDFAYDELMQKVPVMRDGRKLTGPELIQRAEVMARNGDPVVGPLFEHYQTNKTEYQRLVERAAAGANAPVDLGMGGNPFSGPIGGALGRLQVTPEQQKVTPAKKSGEVASGSVGGATYRVREKKQ